MGLSWLGSTGCLTLGAFKENSTGICLKFFPVSVGILSYMGMYSCAVIYSQNVSPPAKLWQESVKIEKTRDASVLHQEKSLGDSECDPLLGWAPSGRVSPTFPDVSEARMILREPQWGTAGCFSAGEGGWTAAACGVQEFRVNNWTVSWPQTPWTCEGFNLLLMGAPVLWGCSSLPRQFQPLGLFATIIYIYKKSEVPAALCLKW